MGSPYLPGRWLLTMPDRAGISNVFPFIDGQTLPTLKTPTWRTLTQTTGSGREYRAAFWSYPRWKWTIDYDRLRRRGNGISQDQWAQLVAFYNTYAGQFGQWNYFDPDDNTVVNQSFGTGDGTTTAFQLTRSIVSPANTFVEPIFAVNGTPIINVAGSPTTAWVNEGNGIINFNSAPALNAALTWSGSFFFVCRFDADDLDLSQDFQNIWSLSKLSWMSLKP